MFNLRAFRLKFSLMLLSGIALGCSSCACNDDYCDDPTPTPNNDDLVELSFLIDVGGSRSSYDSGYGIDQVNADGETSDGTYNENYIDPNQVRVFFSSGSSGYGGNPTELTVESLTRVSSTTYKLRATTASLPTSACRVFVTANWPYDPGTSTTNKNNIGYWCVTQGSEYQYHYGTKSACKTISNSGTTTGEVDYRDAEGNPTYYTPSPETPMPMFGIKTISDWSAYAGHTSISIGAITMIRSMAKIIVQCSCEGESLENVTLAYSYDVGCCAPATIYIDSATEDIDPSVYQTLNIPRTFSVGTYNDGYQGTNPVRRIENLPFRKFADNKFVIYIPSYNNVSVVNVTDLFAPNSMSVKIEGIDEPYTLQFVDSYGATFNICRNYMYIFDVDFDHLQLKYSVEAIDNFFPANISFD